MTQYSTVKEAVGSTTYKKISILITTLLFIQFKCQTNQTYNLILRLVSSCIISFHFLAVFHHNIFKGFCLKVLLIPQQNKNG